MRELGLVAMCSVVLVACGGGGDPDVIDAPPGQPDGRPGQPDAPPGQPDAPSGQPDAPPGVLSCTSYCMTIADNCADTNRQYNSFQRCLGSCATWTVGSSDDTSGNTLGCRSYHADLAATNPDLHCRHAGPGGDGACGANCDGFCTLDRAVCTGANQVYASEAACQAACAGWATTPPYNATILTGDSLSCRLYHATVASVDTAHCPHTAVVSSTCHP